MAVGTPRCNEADFIALFEELGPTGTALELNIGIRSVLRRRKRIERDTKRVINGPLQKNRETYHLQSAIQHPDRIKLEVKDGYVIVGSDAHYWPHIKSTAHRAMVKWCKDYQPKVIVQNGDVLDLSLIHI